jgi:molecular chaperone DnaK (HSP70)
MNGIEKQRKRLSSDEKGSVNLECIFMDEDLYHELRLEEYLAMMKPIFDKYTEFFKHAYHFVSKSGYKIHSVEIVGGGSRIP